MKTNMKWTLVLLGLMFLVQGCALSSAIIKSEPIANIPDQVYEDIIVLYTPDKMPLEPAAGYVYILPGGKVKTDFAREIFVKDLKNLDRNSRISQNNMGQFAIKDSKGNIRGYYEILFDYRVHVWEQGENVLLMILIPEDKEFKVGGPGNGGGLPGGGGK
ncbi:MAG: hypothetical protein K4571_14090 [Deltaproteobacteria bacterium]